MSIRIVGRCCAMMLFAATIAACSTKGSDAADSSSTRVGRSDECVRDRRACIYEGRYEANERDYAEEEARRLNQGQLRRMRRW